MSKTIMKTITYKFQHGANIKLVRLHDGTSNLPKTGMASIKSIKENCADRWGVPSDEVKVTRMVQDIAKNLLTN